MSKKIKKALKGLAKVAIPAAAIAALMRGGKGSDKFLASGAAGGARLPKGDAFARARKLMTSNAAMRGLPRGLPKGGVTIPMNPQMLSDELMMLNEGTDFGLGPMDGAKSGGRITKSGVKRKVSKFAKKKKQANRSKKK